jgi:hypothetical protein
VLTNGSSAASGGLIEGQIGVYVSGGAATVINYATISGITDSVKFASAGDELVAESGSQFIGQIAGGGGTLVLSGGTGTITGLGGPGALTGSDTASFTGFGSYVVVGGSWTVEGTDAATPGQSLTVAAGGTILVSGDIGGGVMSLTNQAGGVIDAGGVAAASLDTGANKISNAGLIEATGSGGMTIVSAVVNTGTILAAGATLTAEGVITGAGKAVIATGGELALQAAFNEAVSFIGVSGELVLAKSQVYTATISGFSTSGGTSLDLEDIGFVSAGEATFSGGVLTVSDGAHTAHIMLAGNFSGSAFTCASDGHGGTIVTDPTTAAVAQAMAGFGPAPGTTGSRLAYDPTAPSLDAATMLVRPSENHA